MAAFWRRESDQMAKRCWQCGAKLPSTGNLCGRCGATRVKEERVSQLAIPANGWYAPPDLNIVPRRYSSHQTRTDTAVDSNDATSAQTPEEETDQRVYTPPIFDAEVYASAPTRPVSLPKEYTGHVYTPPENLYDVPESAQADDGEPNDDWLARFQG